MRRKRFANSYSNDPRWIIAKFAGQDHKGNPVLPGQRVFYYPSTMTILTGEAAEQAARDFEAACADEVFYNG